MVRPKKHVTSKAFNVNSKKKNTPTTVKPKISKPYPDKRLKDNIICMFFHDIDYEDYENIPTFDGHLFPSFMSDLNLLTDDNEQFFLFQPIEDTVTD